MKNLQKKIIHGNTGVACEVWVGLTAGDILICVKGERGLCDDGNINVLWEGDLLVKDKLYVVHHITNWGGVHVAYVMNDDGALTWATTEHFKLI